MTSNDGRFRTARKALGGLIGRRAFRRGMPVVAVAAVAALIAAGTGAPALALPTDASESEGQLLSGSGAVDLDNVAAVAPAYSATPSGSSPVTRTLDATVLGGVNADLGQGVQLLSGANPVIKLGVSGQYARSAANGDSYAASGAVDGDGAIAVANPDDNSQNTVIDLSPVLAQAGLDQSVIDKLRIELGAVSASATGSTAGTSGDYQVAGGHLILHSNAVGGLSTTLSDTLGGVTDTLNNTLGSSSVLSQLLGAVNPIVQTLGNNPLLTISNFGATAALDTADLGNIVDTVGDITTDDGVMTLDLANGTVDVDLAKLLGSTDGSLNGLDPNTHLLNGTGVQNLLDSDITDVVNKALDAVTTAAYDQLNNTTLTVHVTANLSLLGAGVANLDIPITGPLGGFIGTKGAAAPTYNTNVTLLGLNIGSLLNPVMAGVVSAVQGVIGGVVTPLLASQVTNNTTLNDAASTVSGALTDVFPLLNQVADIIINVQNTTTTTPKAEFTTAGAGTATFTERAVQVNLLPGASLATVNLASASVRSTTTLANLTLTPNSGPTTGGTALTISGDNLDTATSITVGGVSYSAGTAAAGNTQFTHNADGTVTLYTQPHAAGAVPVTVTNTAGTATAGDFSFVLAPTDLALSPAQGPTAGGTEVTISGTALEGATTVTIAGTDFTKGTAAAGTTEFTDNGDGTLTVYTPAHAVGAVEVTVTNAAGTSDPATFTYVAAPANVALTPNSGPTTGGQTVTISGDRLDGATAVKFGGTTYYPSDDANAPADAPRFTQDPASGDITLSTPAAAAAGPADVTVTTPGGTTDPVQYSYVAAPSALALDPNQGPAAGNQTVTITGTDLAGATQVTVDGAPVDFTQDGASGAITFSTPSHAAGAVDVTVTTPGGAATQGYTYIAAPGDLTIAPAQGPTAGGQTVTVSGTGLDNATSVSFAGTVYYPAGSDAASAHPNNPTFTQDAKTGDITLTTPAHAAGPADVAVVTAGGTSPAGTYDYVAAPANLAIDPAEGPLAGGQPVTVTGTGLDTATSVTFDGVTYKPGTPGAGDTSFGYGSTANSIILYTPKATTAGAVDVTVTNPGGTSSPASYTYLAAPTVDAISPGSGPLAGGETVTITGNDPDATSVDFGGTTYYPAGDPDAPAGAPTFTQDPATGDITLTTPPADAAGPVDVTVTNPGGSDATSYTYVGAPSDVSLDPAAGPVAGGQTVTISGTDLADATTVSFAGEVFYPAGSAAAAAHPSSPTFTQDAKTGDITLTTPAHAAGPADVAVTTAGGTSPAVAYQYVTAPANLALDPTSGPTAGSQPVTISGDGLVGATGVTFNGVKFTPGDAAIGNTEFSYDAASDTITLYTPSGDAGAADVTVTNPAGTSAPVQYTYVEEPAITSLDPAAGPVAGGQQVTLGGTGLDGATTVDFGGTVYYPADDANAPAGAPTFTQAGDGTITLTTPAHAAGAVDVTVTTAGGTTPPQTYTYVGEPAISGVSPDAGPLAGGQDVTISGDDLGGATQVKVGDTTFYPEGSDAASAHPDAPTFTQDPATGAITLTTPAGTTAGAADITVTTPGGSDSAPYTYVAAPSNLALSPNQGPTQGGDTVTITGTAIAGATGVKVDGVSVDFTQNASTGDITYTSPAHAAGKVDLTVTTAGGTSAPAEYTYVATPPSADSLSPSSGPEAGGTRVTISGSGFADATSVTVDGPSVPFTKVDDSTITFTTPAGTGGADVVVTSPEGSSDPLTFEYVPAAPSDLALSPDAGPVAGGNDVTITGDDLANATAVTVDGQPVQFTQDPSTGDITFTAPAHAAGDVPVTVTTLGGTSDPATYSYDAVPDVTGVSPATGPESGGTPIVIGGDDLGDATEVTVGDTTYYPEGSDEAASHPDAPTFTQDPSTGDISLDTPPSDATGPVDITVTTPGGTSTGGTFTYTSAPSLTAVTPASGSTNGGTEVTLAGDNLTGATSVDFGGTTFTPGTPATGATTFQVVDDQTITLYTPAHAAGDVTAKVTTPAGTTDTVTYTYDQISGTARISGTTKVGGTLTAVPGTWGPTGTGLTYQWSLPSGKVLGTGSTLKVPSDAAGQPVILTVTGSKAGYASLQATATSATIEAAATTAPTTGAKALTATNPSISGTPNVGGTLVANPGTASPSGATPSYTWTLPNGTVLGHGKTLVVPASASGKTVTLAVTWTKSGYTAVTKKATKAIAATGTKPKVIRLAGQDRYGTALAVSKDSYPAGTTADVVFVALSTNFPDALSAAPAAAKLNGPLLLTPTSVVAPSVTSEIKRLKPKKVVVVGGPNAVSNSDVAALKKLVPNTIRLGGADRYATSLMIAKYAFGSTSVPKAFVATGLDFPDALSASAYAGANNMPVLLVNGKTNAIPGAVASWLKSAHTTSVSVAGGPNAVSAGIQKQLQSLTGTSVKRFGGADRYQTSQLINAQFPAAAAGYLATGLNFPDALTGAAAAGHIGAPLFVIQHGCIPGADMKAFQKWRTGTIKILGGPAALAKPQLENLTVCK